MNDYLYVVGTKGETPLNGTPINNNEFLTLIAKLSITQPIPELPNFEEQKKQKKKQSKTAEKIIEENKKKILLSNITADLESNNIDTQTTLFGIFRCLVKKANDLLRYRKEKGLEVLYTSVFAKIKLDKEIENLKLTDEHKEIYEETTTLLMKILDELYLEEHLGTSDINTLYYQNKCNPYPLGDYDKYIIKPQFDKHQLQFLKTALTTRNNILVTKPPGCGKTFVAQHALRQILSLENIKANHTVMVVVPTLSLASQWKSNLEQILSKTVSVAIIHPEVPQLSDKINVIITTYDNTLNFLTKTFSVWWNSKKRDPKIKETNLRAPSVIILDEIHEIATNYSAMMSFSLLVKAKSPLWMLSATLSNPSKIMEYVNKHHNSECILLNSTEIWNTPRVFNNKTQVSAINGLSTRDITENWKNGSSTMHMSVLNNIAQKLNLLKKDKYFPEETEEVFTISHNDEEIDIQTPITVTVQKKWEQLLKEKIYKLSKPKQKQFLDNFTKMESKEVENIDNTSFINLFHSYKDDNTIPMLFVAENPTDADKITNKVFLELKNFDNSDEGKKWFSNLENEHKKYLDYERFCQTVKQQIKQEKEQLKIIQEKFPDIPTEIDVNQPHPNTVMTNNRATDQKIRTVRLTFCHFLHKLVKWTDKEIYLLKRGIGFITDTSHWLYDLLVLSLFQENHLGIVITTPKKFAGLNLPVRSVAFWCSTLTQEFPPQELPAIKQISGRAGRRGLDNEANLYFINSTKEKIMQVIDGKLAPLVIKEHPTPVYLSALTNFFENDIVKHLASNSLYNHIENKPEITISSVKISKELANIILEYPELYDKYNEIEIIKQIISFMPQKVKVTDKAYLDIPPQQWRTLLQLIYNFLYPNDEKLDQEIDLSHSIVMEEFKSKLNVPLNISASPYYRIIQETFIPKELNSEQITTAKNRIEHTLNFTKMFYNFLIFPNDSNTYLAKIFCALYHNLETFGRLHRP